MSQTGILLEKEKLNYSTQKIDLNMFACLMLAYRLPCFYCCHGLADVDYVTVRNPELVSECQHWGSAETEGRASSFVYTKERISHKFHLLLCFFIVFLSNSKLQHGKTLFLGKIPMLILT